MEIYDISDIDQDKCIEETFYKERCINEKELEQKIIVTYSIKYRDYQRRIRNSQIECAVKIVEKNPTKLDKNNRTITKDLFLKQV